MLKFYIWKLKLIRRTYHLGPIMKIPTKVRLALIWDPIATYAQLINWDKRRSWESWKFSTHTS